MSNIEIDDILINDANSKNIYDELYSLNKKFRSLFILNDRKHNLQNSKTDTAAFYLRSFEFTENYRDIMVKR